MQMCFVSSSFAPWDNDNVSPEEIDSISSSSITWNWIMCQASSVFPRKRWQSHCLSLIEKFLVQQHDTFVASFSICYYRNSHVTCRLAARVCVCVCTICVRDETWSHMPSPSPPTIVVWLLLTLSDNLCLTLIMYHFCAVSDGAMGSLPTKS